MSDDNKRDEGEMPAKADLKAVASINDPTPEKDIVGANDEALRIRVALLEEEHRDLDTAIKALQIQVAPNLLVIARLKKKKLKLKDEISRIYDLVEPDIIA